MVTHESLAQTFQELSGQEYPEEFKAATLIRCSESRLREHPLPTVTEGTSYAHLREANSLFRESAQKLDNRVSAEVPQPDCRFLFSHLEWSSINGG